MNQERPLLEHNRTYGRTSYTGVGHAVDWSKDRMQDK